MKLFRIEYEFDRYYGVDDCEYETITRYRYCLGYRRLGKNCAILTNSNKHRINEIVSLDVSLRGLWVCFHNMDADHYNLTKC